MKTAMQELIDWIKEHRDNDKILMQQHVIAKGYQLLEKEKEQIIEAGNACGLKAIVYHQKLSEMSKDELIGEMVEDGMSHGEEYYNQTYNQNK